ncbi:MAG: hypothetical protein ACKPE3_06580 [Sphaerospermopsis kisseleviana]
MVGFSDSENVKVAGEINPNGTEWYSPKDIVDRCPEGDEIETPYGVKARWEIEKEEEERLREDRSREMYESVLRHNAARKK